VSFLLPSSERPEGGSAKRERKGKLGGAFTALLCEGGGGDRAIKNKHQSPPQFVRSSMISGGGEKKKGGYRFLYCSLSYILSKRKKKSLTLNFLLREEMVPIKNRNDWIKRRISESLNFSSFGKNQPCLPPRLSTERKLDRRSSRG